MKKLLWIFACAAIICLAMAACKQDPDPEPAQPTPPVKLAIMYVNGPYVNKELKIYCVVEEKKDLDGDGQLDDVEFAFKFYKEDSTDPDADDEGLVEQTSTFIEDYLDDLDGDFDSLPGFTPTSPGKYIVKVTTAFNADPSNNVLETDPVFWSKSRLSIDIDDVPSDIDDIEAFYGTWKSVQFNTTRGDTGANENNITETIEINFMKFLITNNISYAGSTVTTLVKGGEGIEFWTKAPYWTKLNIATNSKVYQEGYTEGFKLTVNAMRGNYGYTKYGSFNIYKGNIGSTPTITLIRTNEGGTVINADKGKNPLDFARTYTKQP